MTDDVLLRIDADDGSPMVILYTDGRHEFGSSYDPTLAARLFWMAVTDEYITGRQGLGTR